MVPVNKQIMHTNGAGPYLTTV